MAEPSHLERTLEALRRLNEARRIGQAFAADLLAEELERLDNAVGYMRPIRVEPIPTTGQRQGRNGWRSR